MSGQLALDIGAAAKEFAAEAQMFFAARIRPAPGSPERRFGGCGICCGSYRCMSFFLRRKDAPSCFTSDEDCREMWDEMMTRGRRPTTTMRTG